MTTTNQLKVLALIAALGLTHNAFAQTTPESTGPDFAPGLLGISHTELSYGYVDLDNTNAHGNAYTLELSQPFQPGFDAFLGYEYSRSSRIAGSRIKQHVLDAGVRVFSSAYNWGKPYVEVGAGYIWSRFGGSHDNSFLWEATVGVELNLARNTTVMPYVRYDDAVDYSDGDNWNYGVKANYWLNKNWAAMAGIERDDEQNTTFRVGTNFRF